MQTQTSPNIYYKETPSTLVHTTKFTTVLANLELNLSLLRHTAVLNGYDTEGLQKTLVATDQSGNAPMKYVMKARITDKIAVFSLQMIFPSGLNRFHFIIP